MKKFDLIICVYACDTIQEYKEQIIKMNETYSELLNEYTNIKLIYFLGEERTDLIGDQYINLKNVKNDYLSASYKQFWGLKYIYENYNTKFVICIGTDTYINIKKIDLFLKDINCNENLYIGGHGDRRVIGSDNIFFHSGGPGFIITYECLKKIYPRLEFFMDEWINLCLKNNILNLIPACDVGIAYLVNKKEINTTTINTGYLLFTNRDYKDFISHHGIESLKTLISCHNMSLNDFDEFTLLLKKNNYFI